MFCLCNVTDKLDFSAQKSSSTSQSILISFSFTFRGFSLFICLIHFICPCIRFSAVLFRACTLCLIVIPVMFHNNTNLFQ